MDDAQNSSLVDRRLEGSMPGREATPARADSAEQPAGPYISGPAASFLVQLAIAMHAVAERQRGHIDVLIAERAAAQRDRTRARASLEAGELRRLAADDLKGIAEWSETEAARIRDEARRRTDERRAALEDYLRRHEAIIDAEIGSVDEAIANYRRSLDGFFARLGASMDPSEIARYAESVPHMPDLDEIRANARVEAVAATVIEAGTSHDATPPGHEVRPANTHLVGVMDHRSGELDRQPSYSSPDV
jgi:hypothetical protein